MESLTKQKTDFSGETLQVNIKKYLRYFPLKFAHRLLTYILSFVLTELKNHVFHQCLQRKVAPGHCPWAKQLTKAKRLETFYFAEENQFVSKLVCFKKIPRSRSKEKSTTFEKYLDKQYLYLKMSQNSSEQAYKILFATRLDNMVSVGAFLVKIWLQNLTD